MAQIQISKSAYEHNIRQIANKVGGAQNIIAVLKDNAYGHGAKIIAPIAAQMGVIWACVKNESEADEIEKHFENILILSHIANGNENSRYIYAINDLQNLNRLKSGAKTHLNIDTLMHRNGVRFDEIKTAFEIAKKRNIEICGAFTHFRASDELSGDFYTQRANFSEAKSLILQTLAEAGGKNANSVATFVFHASNSAAIERTSFFDNELVRSGIAQYGYSQWSEGLDLKSVLSLWADRISRRVLKKGERIGYGGVFEAKCDMAVATYDLGYGDGLWRFNGEGDFRCASGERILGKISMDSFSCEDGGEKVCVFDDAKIWAAAANTIEYDILVKLSPLIPRVLVD